MAEVTQATLGKILDDFTGRRDDPDYEQRKTMAYRIHRRNRAYVWKVEKRWRLLDSIRKGYYIPAITVHETVVHDDDGKHRTVREIMDGGNRITSARLLDTGRAGFEVSAEERAMLRATSIQVVILKNLTPAQQREMFKRMNDPTKVSPGQLFAMSDDAPLVQEALALLEDPAYPERERLDKHFPTIARLDKAGRRKDSDGRTVLANAVGVVAGLSYGCHTITTSFDRQEDVLLEEIDREAYLPLLKIVLDIFDAADAALPDFDKRKRAQQWGLGFVLGAIIYDIKCGVLDSPEIHQKWRNYLVRVRAKTPDAEEAARVGGGQNLTATRLLRISKRVETFLAESRLLTSEELKEIHHVNPDLDEREVEEEDEEEVESVEE
jgi:hypothetical protein